MPTPTPTCLSGLVTDEHLDLAEQEFPGIYAFFSTHRGEHRTFLDLLAAFMGFDHAPASAA